MQEKSTIEEIPKCKSCGWQMLEIGELVDDIQDCEVNVKGFLIRTGIRHLKLYQCPDCKDVKIYSTK